MSETPDSGEMSLVQHLGELRRAILLSLVFILLSTVACFSYKDPLLQLLQAPAPKGLQFVFVGPAEAFMAVLQASVVTGLFLSLPFVLWQVYTFVAPGLTGKERRWGMPLVLAAYLLFAAGVAFSYLILLPVGIQFLIGFAPAGIAPMISIGRYIAFTTGLMLATGIAFELPLGVVLGYLMGLLSRAKLVQARKYVFLGAFVAGALVTPSVDILTMSLLAFALYGLYELSLLLIRLMPAR